MASTRPDWDRCNHDGCIGVRLPSTALCLAHAADQAPDAFDAELKRIRADGTVDARGVVLSAELLRRILAAVPHEDGSPVLTGAKFDRASFEGLADFESANFQGTASFETATFHGLAVFDGASFHGGAWFEAASFQGIGAFHGASFHGGAWFYGVSFEDMAVFTGASFGGTPSFETASFHGLAVFDGASFHGGAWFGRVTFHGLAVFDGAGFEGEAWFGDVNFERATQIGPLLARKLNLDGAIFGARVRFEAVAAAVCARRAQFPNGVHMRLRYATVTLDDANLAASSTLVGVPSPFPWHSGQEKQVASRWQRMPPGPRLQRWRPRLLSICLADVAGLRLADVDLRACRFAGAHNLDKLRIEGAPLFARSTGWWRVRRKTLAEEQHWRANHSSLWRPGGWYPQVCQPPASPWVELPGVLEPARLAPLYRDLRKGREDAKDEPGAADFYYGECEMRRRDSATPRAERLVLWLYWLLSGYGLRAWRALAALAVVVVLAGFVMAFWGFPSSPPTFRPAAVNRGGALVYVQQPAAPPTGVERLPDAIRFSARSATALLRGPDRALTPLGEWLDIGLRFVGPVLLGLAILSVRGRVRR